jgi:hypothetical protein
MTFHEACRAVLARCPDMYAKAYANAGLEMNDPDYVRAQALYILVNTSRWRGDEARSVKTTLREIGGK